MAINFTSLDLGADDDAQAEAARRAINDPQIIAAIVDATKVTVPLFNAAGILQVAPSGDPSLAATRKALPSGKRTVGALGARAPADFAARLRGGVRARAGAGTPRTATGRWRRAEGHRDRGYGRKRPHPGHRRLLS